MTEKTTKYCDFLFSVAPMMDWTDRHCRVFHRLMTRRARLYTEMLTTGAIIHGDRRRLLGFDASEHPVALQLGGSSQRKETEYEAKEVIMTGWKRSRAPSVAASSSGMPCSLSVLELDDQDAVLRHQPDGGALGRI